MESGGRYATIDGMMMMPKLYAVNLGILRSVLQLTPMRTLGKDQAQSFSTMSNAMVGSRTFHPAHLVVGTPITVPTMKMLV